MSLLGSLEEIKLVDVLRLFAQGKKSGRLLVTNDEHQTALRFEKGGLVHARASIGRLEGEDAVLDLFGWRAGQLTFVPDEKTVTPNVRRGIDELVLDGLRLGETCHRMNLLIPDDRVVFQMAAPAEDAAPFEIGPREWRVLRFVDGARDVREILDATRLTRGEVVRALFELVERGYLERVVPAKSLRAVAQGLFGKDSAEMDARHDEDWRRLLRFGRGVLRVEVRASGGRSALVPASFKGGLVRDVQLPRSVLSELGVREGDDVLVKPVA
ncbi:MAG TPA: DUF4388 domain-containing protein [Vicinamibacteria bacterium]|nr:DUF4388 domain-containing protein [Vicinamibacteria bacterium]